MLERLAYAGLLMLAAAMAWSAAADAQPSAGEAAVESALAPVPTAPVVVDGIALFNVRGVSSYPASARAADIARRIAQAAQDARLGVESLRVEERPSASLIAIGNRPLVTVVDADARVEGVERKLLASIYADRISRAIVRYRAERSTEELFKDVAYALGALAALAIALAVLGWLRRRVNAILERRYHARLQALRIHGFTVFQAGQLWSVLRGGVTTVHVVAALACIYGAVHFALIQFPQTRAAAGQLLNVLAAPLRKMGEGVVGAVPDLVFLAILVLVTGFVLKTLRLYFAAVAQGAVKLRSFDAEWAWPTYRVVRLLIVAFAVVIAYPYIPGSQSAAFKGISVFLGVILSLGSTSLIANIIGGYALTYRRAFRVGDRIRVGDAFGDVTEIHLQVTHLRSLKNEEIVVPNSTILASPVTNYSKLARTDGLILHTSVGIGYETPWRQVEAMLLMAAERTAGVLREPRPFVLQTALGDFAVSYELNAYCDRPAEMNRAYTELHRNILDVFNEYDVAIMTPAYEGDPEARKVVPRDRWYAAPAQAPREPAGKGAVPAKV